jgi:formate-dependent phosphoribosylglycinamide formyltransferase (GAR transformylase)
MVRGDEVYFSDVTARPFESGLVTTRTQRLSEFELQARAILGLPVDTIMISPGAAEVIYAGGAVQGPHSGGALADALRRPESDVRVFSHDDSEARRPLGAAVVTAGPQAAEDLGLPCKRKKSQAGRGQAGAARWNQRSGLLLQPRWQVLCSFFNFQNA